MNARYIQTGGLTGITALQKSRKSDKPSERKIFPYVSFFLFLFLLFFFLPREKNAHISTNRCNNRYNVKVETVQYNNLDARENKLTHFRLNPSSFLSYYLCFFSLSPQFFFSDDERARIMWFLVKAHTYDLFPHNGKLFRYTSIELNNKRDRTPY